jgi:uncharacterized protein YegP (UPF0339 family)
MKTTIIAVPTQKAWDDLMEYIEVNYPKVRWNSGNKPTDRDYWDYYSSDTCILLYDNIVEYCSKSFYEVRYHKIPIITINQFKSMKKTAPTKKNAQRTGQVVHEIRTQNNSKWEIYHPEIGKSKTFDKKVFNTRLVSRNGKIINDASGFNSKKSAIKNINATIKSGLILPTKLMTALKKAKSDQSVLDAINGHLYCCPK